MPSVSLQAFAAWSNYHLTAGDSPIPGVPPSMTITRQVRTHCADADPADPAGTIAATAAMLMDQLGKIDAMRTHPSLLKPVPGDFASGVAGRGWSYSALVGTTVSQIMAEGLAWCAELPKSMRAACAKHAHLALVGGGTRLREVVSWAEPRGLSIPTSGTHLGPSVAGGFGTSSHGARLGFGGLQNMVRGMHIVTGPRSHVWLQRANAPVLGDDGVAALAAQLPQGRTDPPVEIACTAIADDALFDAALVHLGAMGIIDAVALELVPIERFAVAGLTAPMDDAWLAALDAGDFQTLADRLGGCGRRPQFYEVTFNPMNPQGDPAAHLVYFLDDEQRGPAPPAEAVRPVAGDVVCELAERMADRHGCAGARMEQAPSAAMSLAALKAPDDPPSEPDIAGALASILEGDDALYAAYVKRGGFEPADGPIDLSRTLRGNWGEIHGDEISGGIPGALYNASFAIPRERTGDAVRAASAAVADLAPSFVFTLRFVDRPVGLLAFTRFEHNAVLEIDGLSPLICHRVLLMRRQAGAPEGPIDAALAILATTLERGSMAIRAALEQAGIPFAMHWAKLGNIDAEVVAAAFDRAGSGEEPSALQRWRAARDTLLPEASRVLFRNRAVEDYGLLLPLGA